MVSVFFPPRVIGQLVRAGLLLAFLGLGLRIPLLRAPGQRRRAVDLFLVFLLLVHAATVASQTDCWPFSTYPMMANDATRQPVEQLMIALKGVDREGTEWDVDPLAWSPLFPQSIRGWFEIVFPRASERDRRAVAQFLFEKAEAARGARLAGERFGNERWLGPLAASDTYWYPPVARTSEQSFVALRVYRLSWDRNDLLAGRRDVRRTLLIEHRQR
jgi:hypothetical protein